MAIQSGPSQAGERREGALQAKRNSDVLLHDAQRALRVLDEEEQLNQAITHENDVGFLQSGVWASRTQGDTHRRRANRLRRRLEACGRIGNRHGLPQHQGAS
jgi:hypothetical protein